MDTRQAKYVLTLIRNGWEYRSFNDDDVEVFCDTMKRKNISFVQARDYVNACIDRNDKNAPTTATIINGVSGGLSMVEVWAQLRSVADILRRDEIPATLNSFLYAQSYRKAVGASVDGSVFEFGTVFGWKTIFDGDGVRVFDQVRRMWEEYTPKNVVPELPVVEPVRQLVSAPADPASVRSLIGLARKKIGGL
jgi:hypothetical protein